VFFVVKVLRQVPAITTREGPLDKPGLNDWERAETIEVAHRAGIDKVRGHRWVAIDLSQSDRNYFAEEVCARKDLCYKCGYAGHM